MEPTEESLLAKLRRWKCNNPKCGHEHVGKPAARSGFRKCPRCKSPSFRTHEVLAVYGSAAELESWTMIRKQPSRGVLASMSLTYDHAIFAPSQEIGGFLNGETLKIRGHTAAEITAVMSTMQSLYELIAFYRPEREPVYTKMLDAALTAAAEDKTVD